jgi:hypothetical protein
MRPPRELTAAFLVVLVLLVLVARLGSERNQEPSADPRRSTYLTGPAGTHGFAAALERLGITVVRLRQRLPRLDPAELRAGADRQAAVFAVRGPTFPLDAPDAAALVRITAAGMDLLLAGGTAAVAMQCFGYRVRPRLEAVEALPVGEGGSAAALQVHAVLRPLRRDSAQRAQAGTAGCAAPAVSRADTVFRTGEGDPVVVRLELVSGTRATLVADDEIFSNRVLRSAPAATSVLRLVAGRYERLLVDEYDHGFGPSGRLDRAVVGWIRSTAWGWAGLQLAAVGLLVLFTAGARFGPARRVIDRRRRSPLEHVHALATALAAARGHDLAVRLLVRGLQRRLARAAGGADRRDPAAWLADTAPRLRTPAAREAADRLLELLHHPVPTAGVLAAAEHVETIWSDLTSASRPAMSSSRRG